MQDAGELLFLLRRKRRLSQVELARLAGVDPNNLSGVENGRRPAPAESTLERLLDALEATAEERDAVMTAARYSRRSIRLSDQTPPAAVRLVHRLAEAAPNLQEDRSQLMDQMLDVMLAIGTQPPRETEKNK